LASAVFWIIPVAVLGAVVGSFSNVVIFRLPIGLSVTQPRWSFCPHCRKRIRFYHNVPIVSWLLLRGRCHDCRTPIARVYPLIECMTALLFVMVWDALFLAKTVPDIAGPAHDWPMAIAYISLFAGLLAMSAMDIESYIIDIRVSVFMTIMGIICHGVWGIPATAINPIAAKPTNALPPALCLIGAAMGLIWLLTWLIGSRARGMRDPQALDSNTKNGPHDNEDVPVTSAYTETVGQRFRPTPIVVLCGVILALMAWQTTAGDHAFYPRISAGGERGFVAGFLFMLLLILASMVTRESDDQIIEEIEADRARARPTALREFTWFVPALAVGIGLFVLLRRSGNLAANWQNAMEAASDLGTMAPHAAGVVRAVAAMVFAAALGWTVRILGTLALGKEAFGTGDIYIMAAIGAVAGFWAVVFSFFLAAILALIGVLATLFHKRSRAIPLGPWLAMGAFVTLWLQGTFLSIYGLAGTRLWSLICGRYPALPGG